MVKQGNAVSLNSAGSAKMISARIDRRIRRCGKWWPSQVNANPQTPFISILQHVHHSLNVPYRPHTFFRRLAAKGCTHGVRLEDFQ